MMLAGWITALAAIIMLVSLASRTAFVLAALAIESLGFVLFARSHVLARNAKRER